MRRGVSWLVLACIVLSSFQFLWVTDVSGNDAPGGDQIPIGGGGTLDVNGSYTVDGWEDWKVVRVNDGGRLIVPGGATLNSTQVLIHGDCAVDVDGGTVELRSDHHMDEVMFSGSCRYLNLTRGGSINITGPDGEVDVDESMGGDAVLSVKASISIDIVDSSIRLRGGDGYDLQEAWSNDSLDGDYASGGDATIRLSVGQDGPTLLLERTHVLMRGGEGGDAADGDYYQGDELYQSPGGGYSSGGDVAGRVGAGGVVDLVLDAPEVLLVSTDIEMYSGKGGDAGDSLKQRYPGRSGTGGGGYSGGWSSSELGRGAATAGGDVSDEVGSGGDVRINVSSGRIHLLDSRLLLQGADGGNAGDGGTTADNGGGGGGYSGGGGGAYQYNEGGFGGDVSGDVGMGGSVDLEMASTGALLSKDTWVELSAGNGGDAGDGGSGENNHGGGGGGGYSAGGGGGLGASQTGFGHPGGDGGDVSGRVGMGGSAELHISAARGHISGGSLNVTGGDGGSAGDHGDYSMSIAGTSGGGGGGDSAGGGGAPSYWSVSADGGKAGTVSGTVGDGGDANILFSIARPTIEPSTGIVVEGGSGGIGDSAWEGHNESGRSTGRQTNNGTSIDTTPMSEPLPLSPAFGWHVVDPPTFNWTPVHDSATDGAWVAYRFQLATDEDFTSIVNEFETDLTSASPSLNSGNYYWRVMSVYSGPPRTTSRWSDPVHMIYGPNLPPNVIQSLDDIEIMEDSVDILVADLKEHFSDPDDDWVKYEVEGNEHIDVTMTDGKVYMTPEPNWTGQEELTFIVREYLVDIPLSADLIVNVVVLNVNDPPTIDAVLPSIIMEDEPFSIDLLISDPDPTGDVLSYELLTDHGFLVLDEQTGVLSGLPTNDDVGKASVTINVEDGNGGGVGRGYLLEVVNVNDAPSIITEDVLSCDEDALYHVDYEAVDVDPTMDVLNWTMETDAGFLSCDRATGMVEGIPTQSDVGMYSVLLNVSDGLGGSNHTIFQLEVVAVDAPPAISAMDLFTVTEESEAMLDLEEWIFDPDTSPDQLVLSSDHPAVEIVAGFVMALLYMDHVELDMVEFSVFDGTTKAYGSFLVRVDPTNDPPRLLMIGEVAEPWNLVVDEGAELRLEVKVEDVDSPYVLVNIQAEWKHMSLEDGFLHIDAPKGSVGIKDALLILEDDLGGVSQVYFSVRVVNVNDPPDVPLIISPLNSSRYVERAMVLEVDVDDPDLDYGQVLLITWSSDLAGELFVHDSDHDEDIIIGDLGLGEHVITVTVYDGEFSVSASVMIIVEELPPPPLEDEGMSTVLLVGLVAAAVLVVVIALFVVTRRRSMGIGVDGPSGEGDSVGLTDDGPTGPSDPGRGTRDPPSTGGDEPLPLTQEAALEALRGLPRALPPGLWAYGTEELATKVVEAPSASTVDGRPTVEVDGRWYLADPGDVETFLEPWDGEVVR